MQVISNNLKPNNQDILLATIHNLENVTEVYLNSDKNLITELIHHSNHRVNVYQYEFDNYIVESGNFNAIDEKITEMLQIK